MVLTQRKKTSINGFKLFQIRAKPGLNLQQTTAKSTKAGLNKNQTRTKVIPEPEIKKVGKKTIQTQIKSYKTLGEKLN